jgi:DNA-binding NtrC family response regulator
MLFQEGDRISPEDLFLIDPRTPSENRDPGIHIPPDGIDLENVEREYVLKALEITQGNRAAAARLLGLTPATLYYRLKKYNLV